MRLNWISYYLQYNGFGRSSAWMVQHLQGFGVDVKAMTAGDLERPEWMLNQMDVRKDDLRISYLDLRSILKAPGKHWLFTMCEGNKLAAATVRKIKRANVERLLVPSQFCADVFAASGFNFPISVVHLGTDPDEFPLITEKVDRPYTFLTLADRGDRKGWHEVYNAFYKAFGGKTTGNQNVRLIIKSLPNSNPMLTKIAKAEDWDPRIKVDISEYSDMTDLYRQADCVALPSRSEGWGMPHREAAMMGLPVILQKNSGLDDGHTEEWAIVLPPGEMRDINDSSKLGGGGTWEVANVNRVTEAMLACYDEPDAARLIGLQARNWLSSHQTWMDCAANLIEIIAKETGYGSQMDNSAYYAFSRNSKYLHRPSALVGQVRSA